MKQGLQEAINEGKTIKNITSMKITLENNRIARHQLIDPDDEDTHDDEEQTQDQKNFLVVTSEPPVPPPEEETILLSTTSTNEPQGPPAFPNAAQSVSRLQTDYCLAIISSPRHAVPTTKYLMPQQ